MSEKPKVDLSKIYPEALTDAERILKRQKEEEKITRDFRKQRILEEREKKIPNDDVSLAQIAGAFLVLAVLLPYFHTVPVVGIFSSVLALFTPFYFLSSIWFSYKSLKASEKIKIQTNLSADGLKYSIIILIANFVVILFKFFNILP